jgi:hypothetical protein
MVWKPKKVQSSASTPPGTDVPSSSKKWRGRSPAHWTIKASHQTMGHELAWGRTPTEVPCIFKSPYFIYLLAF